MKFTLTIEGDTNDKQSVSVLALIAGIADGTMPNIPQITSGVPGPLAIPLAEPDDEPAVAVQGDPNERDANGLPWDERIHSKARSKNTDGTWRKRKGVAADLVTAVEAELRTRAANPTPQVAPAASVTPPASAPASTPVNGAPPPSTTGLIATPPASPSEAPVTPAPATPVTPPAPTPAPVTPVTPPAPAAAVGPTDFGQFMEGVSRSMAAGKIDSNGEFIAWMNGALGVGQITEIAANPAKITEAYNLMVQESRWI